MLTILYKKISEDKENVVIKVNWKLFGIKLWDSGIKDALDLVVEATDNPWDNATIEILDQVITRLLRVEEKKELDG